jgi:hypothetical protein
MSLGLIQGDKFYTPLASVSRASGKIDLRWGQRPCLKADHIVLDAVVVIVSSTKAVCLLRSLKSCCYLLVALLCLGPRQVPWRLLSGSAVAEPLQPYARGTVPCRWPRWCNPIGICWLGRTARWPPCSDDYSNDQAADSHLLLSLCSMLFMQHERGD